MKKIITGMLYIIMLCSFLLTCTIDSEKPTQEPTAAPTNGSGVIEAGPLDEPDAVSSTADTYAEEVAVLDFIIKENDSDELPLLITEIRVLISGTGDPSTDNVTWRLKGPDVTADYGNVSANVLTFSGLNISIADGDTPGECYQICALFSPLSNLADNETFILSIDGDTDVTLDSGSSGMTGINDPVTNGAGFKFDVTYSQLIFLTQPPTYAEAGTDFTGSFSVAAVDENNKVDAEYTGSVTISACADSGCINPATGVLSSETESLTLSATEGVATWADTEYDREGDIYIKSTDGSLTRCSNIVDIRRYSRPYVMILADTSSSMISCTNPAGGSYSYPNSCPSTAVPNECGMEPTRINDLKCALRQIVQNYASQVNFGLTTNAVILSGCGYGDTADSCTASNGSCSPPAGVGSSGEFYQGNGCAVSGFQDYRDSESCGNEPDCNGLPVPSDLPAPPWTQNWENGGNIVVEVVQDPTWEPVYPPPLSNSNELLKWFDGYIDESKELYAIGVSAMFGSLQTIHQYFAYGWSSGWNDSNYCASAAPGDITHATPLDFVNDHTCRSLNIILITDGDQSSICDGDPVTAAAGLYNAGVVIQSQAVPVRTHVINMTGAAITVFDDIADAGDDGISNSSKSADVVSGSDELVQALTAILTNITSGSCY